MGTTISKINKRHIPLTYSIGGHMMNKISHHVKNKFYKLSIAFTQELRYNTVCLIRILQDRLEFELNNEKT